MSHAFKVFLKIINKRIYGKCEKESCSLVSRTVYAQAKNYILYNYSYKNAMINEKMYLYVLYALSITKKHLTTYDIIN
jgi:hypothetical protein